MRNIGLYTAQCTVHVTCIEIKNYNYENRNKRLKAQQSVSSYKDASGNRIYLNKIRVDEVRTNQTVVRFTFYCNFYSCILH